MDLSAYPTTLLQQFGFFIIFFFPTVSLLVVSLRVYDRILTKNFGWDDIFIIAAVVSRKQSLNQGKTGHDSQIC